LPFLDAEMDSEFFHVLNEVPRRVFAELGIGSGSPATALIEQDDAVGRGIVKPAHCRIGTGTWAAMHHDDRLAFGVAAFLEIDLMQLGNHQSACPVWFGFRVERKSVGHGVLASLCWPVITMCRARSVKGSKRWYGWMGV
jgi:hypothetical protein